MKKYYCDCCEKEITGIESHIYEDGVEFSVPLKINGGWSVELVNQIYCFDCAKAIAGAINAIYNVKGRNK